MRIACPECNAVYELPSERVRPGRGVKCAKCASVWVPVALADAEPEIPYVAPPDPPAAPLPPPAEPDPAPPVRTDAPPLPDPVATEAPASRLPVVLAWVASLVLLVVLCWLALTYRTTVVEAWPPAARAYRWLRLG